MVEDLDGDASRLLRAAEDAADQAGSDVVPEADDEEGGTRNPFGFQGEILGADREHLRLGLEFGESRFAVADIPPEGLAEMAVRLAEATPDSNEHYRRRELVAVFAYLTMPDSAAGIVEGLMAENRPFRERWARVMAGTAR